MDLTHRVNYYLEPGYIYFSKSPAIVQTVVGSCIAVCLWDRILQYGGMNHFVRPVTHSPEEATPQFGNVATAALIRIMEEAGCHRKDLVAQITGGGFPEDAPAMPQHVRDLGVANIQAARDVLIRKGIQIVSEDIGGSMGRKLVFDTSTGQLVVLKVHKIRSSDWIFE